MAIYSHTHSFMTLDRPLKLLKILHKRKKKVHQCIITLLKWIMKSTLEDSTSSPLGVIGFSSIDLNCQIYACEDLSEDLFSALTMFIAA